MPAITSRASRAGSSPVGPPAEDSSEGPLPLWWTLKASLGYTVRHQSALMRLAGPWLALSLVIGLGGMWLGTAAAGWLVADLVSLAGTYAVTVAWLRRVLLGEPARWGAPLTRDVGVVILRSLIVLLLSALTAVPVGFVTAALTDWLAPGQPISALMSAAGVIVALYVAIRLQLYIVVGGLGDRRLDLGACWWAMRPHAWRATALYLGLALVVLAAALAGIAVGAGLLSQIGALDRPGTVLPSRGNPVSPGGIVIETLARSIPFALTAVNATLMALVYRHVLGAAPDDGREPRSAAQ